MSVAIESAPTTSAARIGRSTSTGDASTARGSSVVTARHYSDRRARAGARIASAPVKWTSFARVVLAAAAITAALGSADAFAASPASCGPGDKLETGLQGQIPLADRASGRAADGYTCNLREVGFYPSTSFANFDTYGDCAYYSDTIGLYSAEGGTIVLDVSDPRHPVKTDYLTARSATNAGESLRVNLARGLLAADRYTVDNFGKETDPDTKRSLAVYDLKQDCRHPKLLVDATMPTAVGHEGCFQPDGMVYYMASTSTITPIDLTDPAHPKQLSDPWEREVHGCSISDDGNRGYFGDIGAKRLLVADTSEVQQRKPGAQMRDISELATPDNGGQQSTIPVTYDGHPYVIDWSEYVKLGEQCVPGDGSDTNFGYGLIVDMADEHHPKMVSKLQTEVMLPQNCDKVLSDSAFVTTQGLTAGDVFPLIGSRVFLYDSHYCSTDRLHDPTIVACASFGSGIRVYDIRDPYKPHEIAYYNPGTVKSPDGSAGIANATVARPVIRSDLAQIWFPDISKGFHVVQFRDGVWPFAGQDPCPHEDYSLAQYDLGYADCRAQRKRAIQLPSAKTCRSRRDFTIRLRRPVAGDIRTARVYVNGKRVRLLRGSRITARVNLRGLPRRRYTVRVVLTTTRGETITSTRRYRTCVPRARRSLSTREIFGVAPTARAAQAPFVCRLLGARAA